MSYVVYYSDFGLQREGKISNVNHELNLKTLLLLADKVLIPSSHILHANFLDVKMLVDKFSRFFYKDSLFTQLPREYYDFGQYSYDYLANYKNEKNISAIRDNCRYISYYMFPEKQKFRIYNSKDQIQNFYSMINKYIEIDDKISEITRIDILNQIHCNSDINNPLSKIYFENIIKELERKKRRNIVHLKTLSEICYYSAGATSNKAIISSNEYLNYELLLLINRNVDVKNQSSEFYNAQYFIEVLKILGIIEGEEEICNLTYDEIVYLRKQKCFHDFLNTYYKLSISLNDICEFWKKERKKIDSLNTIKSLIFNFGLTISESILTTFYFQPDIHPIIYTIIIWALQTYIESTKFKPIVSLKYFAVDCIIDKVGFGNDVLLGFCDKIKKEICRARDKS